MSKEIRQMIDKVKNFKQFVNEQKLNEISSDTFKSAINVSKERGTDNRTEKLGTLYFNKFIGLSLLGGKISNIKSQISKTGHQRIVQIEIDYFDKNLALDTAQNKKQKDYIDYDIDTDYWNLGTVGHTEDVEIYRKDAVLLGKIALYINENSKYKETGKYFNIKGW